jgi:prepilin-type processing-associated H-X9-DG protein
MRTKIKPSAVGAVTFVEVLVVIAAVVVLMALLLPALAKSKARSSRIGCVNNLKQIGLAFKIWAGDGGDRYQMRVSVKEGGTMEWETNGEVWPHFLVMSNELNTPKVLVCPQDKREPTTTWTSLSNSTISYFVGVDAQEYSPPMLLSGDSNFAIDGQPVTSGLLNLWTNAAVGWTKERHGKAGNVAFADGSAQQVSNAKLHEALAKTGVATNRLAIP